MLQYYGQLISIENYYYNKMAESQTWSEHLISKLRLIGCRMTLLRMVFIHLIVTYLYFINYGPTVKRTDLRPFFWHYIPM